MSTTATTSRKSKRIEDASSLPKAKAVKSVISKRLQWKLDNEAVLAAQFDALIAALVEAGGEDNVREEGAHAFENWVEIVADELAPGTTRICNDDSTESEDEVSGLGSEDEEPETEESEEETEESEDAPEYDETDEDEDSQSS